MTKYRKYVNIFLSAAALMLIGAQTKAETLNNTPWGFSNQNRASIAALMKQAEDSNSRGATAAQVGGDVTNLVCGNGANSSTATGNSACIIMNNSNGDISTGQDSTGDQTAENTSTDTTTVNETINTTGPVDTGLGDALGDLSE